MPFKLTKKASLSTNSSIYQPPSLQQTSKMYSPYAPKPQYRYTFDCASNYAYHL